MKTFFITCFFVGLLGVIAVWDEGSKLSSPAAATIGPPPLGHNVENVVTDGVHGWFFPAIKSHACILLLHGIRSNRKEMVNIALFLKNEGYSSLAIDLQAHGESFGNVITFGYKESFSAHSALNFLKTEKACKKTVVIGRSLGAAASLLGPKPIEVDGYILEAVYPSIETAVQNRLELHLGVAGKIVAPLFYYQIPLRLGIELDDLQPLKAIENIKAPVLIMNGTEDKRTTVAQAQTIFKKSPNPKEFVTISGASHVNLFSYNPEEYKKAVLEFLLKYLPKAIEI